MDEQPILVEQQAGYRVITLNRPQRLNAFTEAMHVALRDERVKRELGLNDEPQAAMHYWARRDTELAYSRRSAAVLFGQPGERPSLVAVVDLVDRQVTDVVPADQW